MDTKKFLIGTVAGGVAFFMLGYLIYGIALMDFMAQHGNPAVNKTMEEMSMGALFVGNLASAALLTYIFLKWANVNTFGGGASAAFVIGLLMALGYDLTMYGTTNLMDVTGLCVDVVAATIMTALGGGIIGMVLGMGKKSA